MVPDDRFVIDHAGIRELECDDRSGRNRWQLAAVGKLDHVDRECEPGILDEKSAFLVMVGFTICGFVVNSRVFRLFVVSRLSVISVVVSCVLVVVGFAVCGFRREQPGSSASSL